MTKIPELGELVDMLESGNVSHEVLARKPLTTPSVHSPAERFRLDGSGIIGWDRSLTVAEYRDYATEMAYDIGRMQEAFSNPVRRKVRR
jgi:hypothetical protein